jgi:hypothetical protein
MTDQSVATMPTDHRFDRWAGWAAAFAVIASLVYTVGFVGGSRGWVDANLGAELAALGLMVGGLLSAVALFAVYSRVRGAGSLATLGLVLGLAGTLGAALHGAYDLANVLHPEAAGSLGTAPFPADPRGFLTFGVAGLGVLALSRAGMGLMTLPRNLLMLGLVFGVVLVVIYLGRLVILDANSMLVLGPAVVGAVISPVWYGWLAYHLLSGRTAAS